MTFYSGTVYEAAEDSKLLLEKALEIIKTYPKNKKPQSFCEVGVGSGFVISQVAKNYPQIRYFGCDINKDALDITRSELENTKVNFELKENNLLDNIEKEFDIIVFNTPYLPLENKKEKLEEMSMKDRAIYGGKSGYEVTEKFIYQINSHLKEDGVCLIIISTLTKADYVENLLEMNLFNYETVASKYSFFEEILCLRIEKSEILKKINKKGIKNIKYLASGKHSTVLEGKYKNNSVIIKAGKFQHLQKEAIFEEKLSNLKFVPKMFFKDENFVIREKIEGTLINDFILISDKKSILNILNKILAATFEMDEMGINKFEMTNPYKHIYVLENEEIKFIDFERCIYTDKPKNTTQVLEFFRRQSEKLKQKKIILNEKKILEISKKYKKDKIRFKIEELLE